MYSVYFKFYFKICNFNHILIIVWTERSDSETLGILVHFRHFRHFSLSLGIILTYGGERGIRTLGAAFGSTHDFQSCSFSQLGHLSVKNLGQIFI